MTDLPLLNPTDTVLLMVDQQAGLAFGVGSTDRQLLVNNTVALAKTAKTFQIPVVISTSASKVYSGPLTTRPYRDEITARNSRREPRPKTYG